MIANQEISALEKSIFHITSNIEFEKIALAVFNWQAKHVKVYQDYIYQLGIDPNAIKSVREIPFLPISFFKSHIIKPQEFDSETIFESSSTGGTPSYHHIVKKCLYEESYIKGFERIYGAIKDYNVLALLPSYLERSGSSLIYMVDDLIKRSNSTNSGFYLHDLEGLTDKLIALEQNQEKTILLGVSYALLDLIEHQSFQLKNTIIMETGGMKGKRKELVKEQLHELLKNGFGVNTIHSEYGMTELLSQSYSKGNGNFYCPPWMKVMVRSAKDPFELIVDGKTGGINVIDLCNLYSCSFIATQDLGKTHDNGCFEVLGRFDNSDIRGCNLMVE